MADAEPRHIARKRAATGLPLPDNVALVLQGGGALGAFQVGVYEALDAARIEVDWVAGISIGAVNAAIIAGNPCERRMERLHAFWDRATGLMPSFPLLTGDFGREVLHELSAAAVSLFGVPGMFRPASASSVHGRDSKARARGFRGWLECGAPSGLARAGACPAARCADRGCPGRLPWGHYAGAAAVFRRQGGWRARL